MGGIGGIPAGDSLANRSVADGGRPHGGGGQG
jgi:hypothetical protein